jgi:hypothetical protein
MMRKVMLGVLFVATMAVGAVVHDRTAACLRSAFHALGSREGAVRGQIRQGHARYLSHGHGQPYGGDWSTDYYAVAGTAGALRISSSAGYAVSGYVLEQPKTSCLNPNY